MRKLLILCKQVVKHPLFAPCLCLIPIALAMLWGANFSPSTYAWLSFLQHKYAWALQFEPQKLATVIQYTTACGWSLLSFAIIWALRGWIRPNPIPIILLIITNPFIWLDASVLTVWLVLLLWLIIGLVQRANRVAATAVALLLSLLAIIIQIQPDLGLTIAIPNLAPSWQTLRIALAQNPFYLYSLLMVVGSAIWLAYQRRMPRLLTMLLIGWVVGFIAGGSPLLSYVSGLTLAAITIEALTASFEAHQKQAVIVFVIGTVVAVQSFTLLGSFQAKPVAQWQAEEAIANWLVANAPSDATVFGAPKIAFSTGRRLINTSLPINDTAVQDAIVNASPDYLIFSDASDWTSWSRSAEFQTQYGVVQAYPLPNSSPYALWARHDRAEQLIDRDLLTVSSPAGIEVVGKRANSQNYRPNVIIEPTLFMRPRWPLAEPFVGVLYLQNAVEGTIFARSVAQLPTSDDAAQKVGVVSAETLSLQQPATLSYGAYQLTFGLQATEDAAPWPLYQNFDSNASDRIFVSWITVPWQSIPDSALPSGATFDQQIQLKAFETKGQWQANEAVELTLYWESSMLLKEELVLFIHLVAPDGSLIVNVNEPVQPSFPMEAWLPGDLIRDQHRMTLPEQLAEGAYQLNIGLFNFESGLRLDVRNGDGQSSADGILPLEQVQIAK